MFGCDKRRHHYRVLKIDRTEKKELALSADPYVYDRRQVNELLASLGATVSASQDSRLQGRGALKSHIRACGILGFVQFLHGFHMVLVTSKSRVGFIGGHRIYEIGDTAMVPISDEKRWSFSKSDEER